MVFTPVAGECSWELIQEKNGIRVYKQGIEGSKYCEFKGVSVIDVRLDVLVAVFSDVNATSQWFRNLEELRIIEQIDPYTMTFYLSLDLPWPISNRDLILHCSSTFNLNPPKIIVHASSVKEPIISVKNGYIRMKDVGGMWILDCTDDFRKTQVTYTSKLDPAGYIPPLLINIAIKKQVYDTLMGLKQMAKDPKYIKAAENSVFAYAMEHRELMTQMFQEERSAEKVIKALEALMAKETGG